MGTEFLTTLCTIFLLMFFSIGLWLAEMASAWIYFST